MADRRPAHGTRAAGTVGVCCILAGVSINRFTLAAVFSSDGNITSLLGNSAILVVQLALVAAGVWVLLRKPAITSSRLMLVFACTVVALIAAELSAWIWLRHYASEEQLSWYGTAADIRATQQLLFSRHHYLPYIPRPGYQKGKNRHNALGFRGDEVAIPKPPEIFRIVLLGGSTTYTVAVEDYTKSYPYVLEHMLGRGGEKKVEVVNAGCHAYSSFESLINLQFRVLDLQPDLVLVYHGINDVHDRLVFPYEAYRGDNAGSRVPYDEPREALWDHSVLLRIVRTRLGVRQPLAGLGIRRTFEYVPTNHSQEFLLQKWRNAYPSGVFGSATAAEMIARNRPEYFERNMRGMIAICQAGGIKIAFMTFALGEGIAENPRAMSDEFRRAVAEHNKIIRALCRDYSVACHEFAEEMPADQRLWSDGVHVTELGAVKKAALVAGFLESAQLVPHVPAQTDQPARN